MLTSVLVVVILGAIIATITRAVLVDDRQPATADAPADGGPTDPVLPDGDQAERPHAPGPSEDIVPVEVIAAPASALGEQAAALLAALAPEPAEETMLVPAADVRAAGRPRALDEAGPLSWWQRVRAVVLLAVMIAALGALAATALGVVLLGGAAFFDQALG